MVHKHCELFGDDLHKYFMNFGDVYVSNAKLKGTHLSSSKDVLQISKRFTQLVGLSLTHTFITISFFFNIWCISTAVFLRLKTKFMAPSCQPYKKL